MHLLKGDVDDVGDDVEHGGNIDDGIDIHNFGDNLY